MPIFEYECESCQRRTEFFKRKNHERPVCSCGSNKMKKILSPFAVGQAKPYPHHGCHEGGCSRSSSPCSSDMCGMS